MLNAGKTPKLCDGPRLGRLQQVRTEPLRRDPRSVLQEIPDTGGNYYRAFANGPEPLEGKSPSQDMPERGCISRETAGLLRNSAQNRAEDQQSECPVHTAQISWPGRSRAARSPVTRAPERRHRPAPRAG